MLAAGAATGSGTALALAIYLTAISVATAALAMRHPDLTTRLMAAATGAGVTLGAAVTGILTYGFAFIPALLLWLAVIAELYREAGKRSDLIAPSAKEGIVTNRAHATAAGVVLAFAATAIGLAAVTL